MSEATDKLSAAIEKFAASIRMKSKYHRSTMFDQPHIRIIAGKEHAYEGKFETLPKINAACILIDFEGKVEIEGEEIGIKEGWATLNYRPTWKYTLLETGMEKIAKSEIEHGKGKLFLAALPDISEDNLSEEIRQFFTSNARNAGFSDFTFDVEKGFNPRISPSELTEEQSATIISKTFMDCKG